MLVLCCGAASLSSPTELRAQDACESEAWIPGALSLDTYLDSALVTTALGAQWNPEWGRVIATFEYDPVREGDRVWIGTSAPEVQGLDRLVIGHGAEMNAKVAELNRFLYRRFYRHPRLQEFLTYATRILEDLFRAYVERPAELAPWYRTWAEEVGLERAVCDYLAGMTDRFAEAEHERLTGGAR